jgi:hypothetical protein
MPHDDNLPLALYGVIADWDHRCSVDSPRPRNRVRGYTGGGLRGTRGQRGHPIHMPIRLPSHASPANHH